MATPNLLAAAQMIPAVLVSTRIAGTADAAVYTVAANHAVQIKSAAITNITGAPVTCGVSIVPAGGAVGDGTHKVVADTFSIAPGDTLPLDVLVGVMLGDGDIVAAHAGAANAIDVVLTGVVIS